MVAVDAGMDVIGLEIPETGSLSMNQPQINDCLCGHFSESGVFID